MRASGWPHFLVTVMLGVATVVALPGQASAQGSIGTETLPVAHTICDNAISRRLNDLQLVEAAVNASVNMTAADRSSLDAIISQTISGLMALETKINADTTLVALRADCATIVTGYRVYLLVDPQARLVVGADRALAAASTLTNLAALLQTNITQKQSAGSDVGDAPSELTQLMGDIQAARTSASGVPGQVAPLMPAGYPGNRPVLVNARSQLGTAQSDLAAAVQASQAIIAALNASG